MNGETEFYAALAGWKEIKRLETEKRLYDALKALKLYVPVEMIGGRKRCITARKNGNEEYIPAFTSASEYMKLPIATREYALCSFDDLKHMILDDIRKIEGIAVNPHGNMVLFPLAAIKRLDSVMSGMFVQKTDGNIGGIQLNTPKSYPNGLVGAIQRFMVFRPEVSRVSLYEARRNKSDKAHWLFWVHFAGRKIDLFPELAQLIRRYMKPGAVFELVQGTGNMGTMDCAEQSVIYERL